MNFWQSALLVLGVLWALQSLGTYLQMRHYRRVLGDITTRWADGYVGVGVAKASFGRGVIAMLVVGADDLVREALVMEGRSVFAKFVPLPDLTGMPAAELRVGTPFAGAANRAAAFRQALEQVDRLRTGRAEAPGPGRVARPSPAVA